MSGTASDGAASTARPAAMFAVAWGFLVLTALLGALLRGHVLVPVQGLEYGYVLHAHSHLAFMGWVFNAFVALSAALFVEPARSARLARLFLLLQVAVVGMGLSFPFQGYGAVSIAFSTLHMIGAAAFAALLWRPRRASPDAARFLRTALLFMLVSGLGPLTLGPLAAADQRDSPAYALAIYFYLHFQYNGWFVFFLLGVLLQDGGATAANGGRRDARHAHALLVAGTVLTFALSALWLEPPGWVWGLAVAGGVLQLAACVPLWRALRGVGAGDPRLARALLGFAGAALLLKCALQAAGALPPLAPLAMQRWIVIAFLHLVLLGGVTPALLALALRHGWMKPGRMTVAGVVVFLAGFVAGEVVLAQPTIAALTGGQVWAATFPLLLLAAAATASATVLLACRLAPSPENAQTSQPQISRMNTGFSPPEPKPPSL